MTVEDDWTTNAMTTLTLALKQRIVERYALVVLYFVTAGTFWLDGGFTFEGTTSICEWDAPSSAGDGEETPGDGVSCDEGGYLVGLDLCELIVGQ